MFIIKDQLMGNSTKVHAQHLKPANIDDWEIPKPSGRRNVRKSKFVFPPKQAILNRALKKILLLKIG